jgi:Ca2+-dependent lipid-binding protein
MAAEECNAPANRMTCRSLFGEASSDPYCELSIGTVVTHERRRTKHIANTLNPVWDEHMSIPVYRPASTLTVKVFDYDKFSKDDHIGAWIIRAV